MIAKTKTQRLSALADGLAEFGALVGLTATFMYDMDGARSSKQWGMMFYAARGLLRVGIEAHLAERGEVIVQGTDALSGLALLYGQDDPLYQGARQLYFASPPPEQVDEYGESCKKFVFGDLSVLNSGKILGVDASNFSGELLERALQVNAVLVAAKGEVDLLGEIYQAHGGLLARRSVDS